jgi:hypothetical protein
MNEGLFGAQINQIAAVLKQHDMLLDRNHFPDYRGCGVARFQNKSYKEIWEICYAEEYYHFLLQDYSLLQFRADFRAPQFHYSFYEPPYRALSYSDFLIFECGFSEEELAEVGEAFRPDYEIALTTLDLKEVVTPIRYDYDPDMYAEARHPASHMHLGHNSSIRIGTKRLLKPLSFLEFILRQCYPQKWIEFLNSDDGFVLCRNVREGLDDIHMRYWNTLDEFEMILD